MHTMVRFLAALRQRTDQETLEEFVIHALRCLLEGEDSELRKMLEGKSLLAASLIPFIKDEVPQFISSSDDVDCSFAVTVEKGI
ncbi:MAG: hypothetical protein IJ013_05355 [Bacteroidaceae bacterium]|nr:hypothetical protein [Bacteroidaceae bacterium]